MADTPEAMAPASQEDELKRVKEEKKKFKAEQKAQKKEAKRRAKELAMEEANIDPDSDGHPLSIFIVTLFIIIIWLAIAALLIKLDVGGFGTNVMTPLIKDIPVLNKILPSSALPGSEEAEDLTAGYSSLEEAVMEIKSLQLQLDAATSKTGQDSATLEQLQAEIARLKTFEEKQVEFQKIKNEFYEEVVYADKGPGPEEYIKYYESMDPATAEALYKEVVREQEQSKQVQDYAQAYSEMKPKQAAEIFEAMTDNLDLVARILSVMTAEDRGKILGVMKPEVSAKITKIMDPKS
ncbi:MAG: hypothetical protein K6E18_03425 [Lachnospiraceae bacterium]|nr:hypothetical protein [Lachnospiraceae bacterium]